MTQRHRALLVAAVIAMGTASSTAAMSGSIASPVTLTPSYQPGDYAPLDVHCNPPTPLPGDTYQCRDGCYSDSKTSHGACSHHGGIDHPVSGNAYNASHHMPMSINAASWIDTLAEPRLGC